MARQLLLEVGLEEVPARFMGGALSQLNTSAEDVLRGARLRYSSLETYGTPRRLVLLVQELASRQEDLVENIRGPAVKVAYDEQGNPTKALLGFAQSQGIDVDAVSIVEVKGIPYVYGEKVEKGRSALAVLPGALETCLSKLSFPKPMRWGSSPHRFIRPLRWLLALYGDQVLPLEFGGLLAGNTTWGHRFLTRGPIIVKDTDSYFKALERGWVIVDQERRRQSILKQANELAAANGGKVGEDPDLLEEITYLVEYPTAFLGRIDSKYMELPQEVLTTSMRKHQRYFPLTDGAGKLLPGFIGFRSGTEEHLSTVRAGNEKVLRARLEDASFFWQEDQSEGLVSKLPQLDRVIYLEGFGSMGDKVKRLVGLTGWLAEHLEMESWVKARAQRAANLAKADLVTAMVGEFPELQGQMGEKYALAAGEETEVALAIGEQYRPRFAGDSLPGTQEGMLLALADKADNLCGCFLAGFIPSGSQDPYGLRRQAQAICSLAMEKGIDLSIEALVKASYRFYQEQFSLVKDEEVLVSELMGFFRQRLQYILREDKVEYDVIDAVLAAGFEKPAAVARRAGALSAFRREEGFDAVLTAYIRAANLTQKDPGGKIRPDLLGERAERELWQQVNRAKERIANVQCDYQAILGVMAELGPAVDTFFDEVMVMVEDDSLRENRLALLSSVVALMDGIADLSKIVQ